MLEELGGDYSADGVQPVILGPRGAAAVAVEARQRICAASIQGSAEDVAIRHQPSLLVRGRFTEQ